MNKIAYMLLGAATSSMILLCMQHKDEINKKMHLMKREGMRTINKVKSMF